MHYRELQKGTLSTFPNSGGGCVPPVPPVPPVPTSLKKIYERERVIARFPQRPSPWKSKSKE